jgi:hypothetical protein
MNWKGCGNEIVKFKVPTRCLKGEVDGKVKVKQARFGPEGSRRFRLPDFMTFST